MSSFVVEMHTDIYFIYVCVYIKDSSFLDFELIYK